MTAMKKTSTPVLVLFAMLLALLPAFASAA